jgi:hypothetical protein
MSPRLNWRLLLGEFIVIVVGILMALWVDELREARYKAALEIEYLASIVTDLEADLLRLTKPRCGCADPKQPFTADHYWRMKISATSNEL